MTSSSCGSATTTGCPPAPAAAVAASIISVLGAQWGDEGKGKLVDVLAETADVCCRFNGGANAGHTLVVNGITYALHLAPCGILYNHTTNLLGNGMVIHLKTLVQELETVDQSVPDASSRVVMSSRAHLLFDIHQKADAAQELTKSEAGNAIGTTKRGIGPCYSTKMARTGLRVGDLLHWDVFERKFRSLSSELQRIYGFTHDDDEELARHKKYVEMFKSRIIDGVCWLHEQIKDGKKILIEGANATFLDIDFGTYPCVTSSSTTSGGICTGLGLPPAVVGDKIIGVVKAYTTRVGEGPFPTELHGPEGQHLMKVGHEYGTTTGRPRRCGWMDICLLRYSTAVCGYTRINLTKLDVLSGIKEVKLCIAYKNKSTGALLPPMSLPTCLEEYEFYEPVYETLPGWDEDLSACTKFEQLPIHAQEYVKRIEELIGCPIKWIGVGSSRTAMIVM